MSTYEAPWFEDFKVGDDFSNVPPVTITAGHCAIHQAMFGDRLQLTLDHELCAAVTGETRALVNPSLVCNVAVGQSSFPSQRVMGNLFYRGLVLQRPVFVGDTLTTTTKVVALRQNRIREGRAASGMVALEIHVNNQEEETVLNFWRCPMIPCRDPNADTGRNDSFDMIPDDITIDTLSGVIPEWDLSHLWNRLKPGAPLTVAETIEVEARDTVTLAPELVRMTLNMAMTHTDATKSVYGERLVYGGHTISMAAAQLSRALPSLATLLGWFKCDHTAPVFEEDILRSVVTVDALVSGASGRIAIVQVETFADRGPHAPEPGTDLKVLDWRLAGLLAGKK